MIYTCKRNLVFVLLFGAIACNNKCEVAGMEVSELLSTAAKEKSIDYCSLLGSAAKGDSTAIKRISLLYFGNAAGYDQGAVLVDLILRVGEDKYIQSISTINKDEKMIIESYLNVGLEYGANPKIKDITLKNIFPKIYTFLKSR